MVPTGNPTATALVSDGVPAILEPAGVSRNDGKRPDGMCLIPWKAGKNLSVGCNLRRNTCSITFMSHILYKGGCCPQS
jgi:hypothetical protein